MKVAFVTAPSAEAEPLARRIVEASLAACVNVVPGLTSIYRWKGKVHADAEVLLMVKVSDDKALELVRKVREWHSYDCPECVLLDVSAGNPDYLEWVRRAGHDE